MHSRGLPATRLLVVALVVFVGGAYLALSWPHRGPIVYADEAGTLGNARWLTGGHLWSMGDASSAGLGYPLLIAPLVALIHSPSLLYRAVLVENAALCAALAGVLYLLARRLTAASPSVAAASSVVACAYPALAVQSSIAWAEIAAMTGVALFVLVAHSFARAPRVWLLFALAAVALFLAMVHARFAAVPLLLLPVLVYLAVTRRGVRAGALGAAAFVVVGWSIARVAQHAVYSARWDANASSITLHDVLTSVPHTLARSLFGEAWYLLAGTVGLIVLGVAGLVRGFVTTRETRETRDAREVQTVLLGYVLVALTSVFLLSAVYMAAWVSGHASENRADHFYYGRYNDAFVPVLVALGVAVLFTGLPRRGRSKLLLAAAAGTVVCGLALSALGGDDGHARHVSRLTVPALFPLVAHDSGTLRAGRILLVATLVAVVLIVLLVALVARDQASGPWAAATVVLLFFFAIAVVDVHSISGVVQKVSRAVPPYMTLHDARPRTVAYDLDHSTVWGYYGFPYWLDDSRFVTFHSSRRQWPRADVYVGPARWNGASQHDLHLVLLDTLSGQGVWAPAR